MKQNSLNKIVEDDKYSMLLFYRQSWSRCLKRLKHKKIASYNFNSLAPKRSIAKWSTAQTSEYPKVFRIQKFYLYIKIKSTTIFSNICVEISMLGYLRMLSLKLLLHLLTGWLQLCVCVSVCLCSRHTLHYIFLYHYMIKVPDLSKDLDDLCNIFYLQLMSLIMK